MNIRRYLAYFLDFVIILAVLYVIAAILPGNDNIVILQNEMNASLSSLLENEIGFSTFVNRYAISYHTLMLNAVHLNVLTLLVLFLYYVLLPLKTKGQTLGKKMFKIKIVATKGELTKLKLLARASLVNGLLFTALSILLLYTSTGLSYFMLVSIIGLVQILFILINVLILAFREKNKTIHDKISYTNVLERSDDNEKI